MTNKDSDIKIAIIVFYMIAVILMCLFFEVFYIGDRSPFVFDDSFLVRLSDGRYRINNNEIVIKDGFRNYDDKKEYDIAIYGDSMISEFYLKDNTIDEEIDKKTGLFAANYGVPGYGPDQEYKVYEQSKKKFKYVILTIYTGNDYGDLIRNKLISDDGIISDSSLSKKFVMTNKFCNSLMVIKKSCELFYKFGGGSTANNTNYVSDTLALNDKECSDYTTTDVINPFMDWQDLNIGYYDDNCTKQKTKLMKNIILKFKNLTDERKQKLIIVIIPDYMDVNKKAREYYNVGTEYDYRKPSRIIEEYCDGLNITRISLYEYLNDSNSEDKYVSLIDRHISGEGVVLMAEKVAEVTKIDS